MRFCALIIPTLLFVAQVFAVFQDEAYQIDFHYALLGAPKQDSTFFHRPQATSSASLLYTLSEKLVLGAANPKDGSIVWRHDLSKQSSDGSLEGILRAKLGENTVVSGVGNHVSAWDAWDGRLVWDTRFEADEIIRDLEIVDDGSNLSTVLVLLGRDRGIVKTLDGHTGEVKGGYVDESGDVPFQVSSSPSGLYYISLHSTMLKGLRIKVTALDPSTKRQSSQYILSSDSDMTSSDSIIFVGANSAAPLIVWTDKAHKTLKVNVIGSKNVHTINVENDTGEEIRQITVHAPQTPNALSHFLVSYRTESRDWAEVYHVNLKSSAISKAYSLPKLMGKGGTFSTCVIDANVYFTRITQSEVTLLSSASHGLLGRWPMSLDYTEAEHAVSEVVTRGTTEFAVRFGLITDGTWRLIRNGDLVWTRPEDLAGTVVAAWVDFDQEEELKHELEIEGHGNIVSAYIHRVQRHARDLKHFREWSSKLPGKILSSFGDSKPLSSFGFNKLTIVGTDSGRVMALDYGNGGRILWNHNLMATTNTRPNISAITVDGRSANIYGQDGTVLKIDVRNGQVLRVEDGDSKAQGFFSVPEHPALVPIHLDGSPAAKEIQEGVVVTLSPDGQAVGWRMGTSPSKLWEFQTPSGQKLHDIVSRPAHDPVASAGRVLGDRTVMYKYLNPNLALITSTSAKTATFHLIDSISGKVLHSATYDGIDTSLPLPSVLSENWFAYSFFADPKASTSAKGYRLIIAELFESPIVNDRGPLDSASNFSSLDPSGAPLPHVISQSYIIPEGISRMSVTQSRQGIAIRQILCTLSESSGIVGIPKPFLDPRRPIDRDPNSDEIEEGLFRYNPVLEFDPKWYLTHARDVMGIQDVISVPSALESTTLLYAFGHDVFGTRVAPSGSFDVLGKEFSKIQLVATVVALSVGVAVLAPMVRKRQVDMRWKM